MGPGHIIWTTNLAYLSIIHMNLLVSEGKLKAHFFSEVSGLIVDLRGKFFT